MAEPVALTHPRDVFTYRGGEAVETAFLDAIGRGRLHHAWLLVGPEGVGKATFAYRAARRLMGAAPDPAFGLLGSSPADPVSRQISARSHPDILALERVGDDGKVRKVIPVDDARKLPEFFSKAPAISPWRVAIVDSIDDMNPNAANALAFPTILSAFAGRAVELAGRDALAVDHAAHLLLSSLPNVDMAAMMAMGESFRGPEGMGRFSLLMERLAEQVHQMAVATADKPGADGDRWSQVWTRLNELPGEVEGVNLDRADAFWTALGELRRAARA